jgi:cell fate (sporulation/competence/biofilm development) regulator YmcA (YheA/YmcA/DUF963 family)
MVVLPIGVTHAQDYEAVGRRLRAAVAAGELTAEQARAMLGALKKADGAKKERGTDEAKTHLMKVKKELSALVEAGKISEEDAIKRYQGAEKAVKERLAAASDRTQEKEERKPNEAREYLMKVRKELGALVEAGKISEEDAIKRYQGAEKAVKERMAAASDRTQEKEERKPKPDEAREYLLKVRKELGAAVEAGKISEEDAIKRYQGAEKAIKERMAGGRGEAKRITREDLRRAGVEIRKAVAEGKLSEEDGRKRMEAMRKLIGEQPEGAAKRDVDWEGIKRRIEGAVESGKMTREEADEAYKGLRVRMAAQREGEAKKRDTKSVDWEGIKRRIEGAVESGKMTREEADAKYKELRERMAGDRDR